MVRSCSAAGIEARLSATVLVVAPRLHGFTGLARGSQDELKPSEYVRRNFAIITSGVEDPLALRFCIDKIAHPRRSIGLRRWPSAAG
jgi:hypothetical protein